MATFEDAATDAEEAQEALRGLAHASRTIARAGDSYPVLGSLSAGLASLRQVLDQLAGWHDDAASLAADDAGDPQVGYRHAIMAAARLRQAAALVERAGAEVDAAWNDNGRIAWQPEPPTKPNQPDTGHDLTDRRRRLAPGSAFGAKPPGTDRDGLSR